MRISDWSSDVCSSDLPQLTRLSKIRSFTAAATLMRDTCSSDCCGGPAPLFVRQKISHNWEESCEVRSEEHTSELQSLMRISYAVFCLKKKKNKLLNNR